jgi:hypothetical protein
MVTESYVHSKEIEAGLFIREQGGWGAPNTPNALSNRLAQTSSYHSPGCMQQLSHGMPICPGGLGIHSSGRMEQDGCDSTRWSAAPFAFAIAPHRDANCLQCDHGTVLE